MMTRTRHRHALTGAVAVLLLVPFGLAPSVTAEPIPPPTAAVPVGAPSPDLTAAAPAARSPSPARSAPVPAKPGDQGTIVEGDDLVLSPLGELPTATPGGRISIPLAVTNVGAEPVDGLTVTVRLTHGLRPATYANCRTQPYDPPYDNSTDTTCGIPGALQPGATYDAPFEATVEVFAGRWQQVIEFLHPTATAATASRATSAQRLALTLRRGTAADDGMDNQGASTLAPLQVDTGLDLAAVGATVVGGPGDVVTVEVGLRNIGPSEIDPTDGLVFLVQLPPGIEAVSTRCSLREDGQYGCNTDRWLVAPGEQAVASFSLRVTTGPDADGAVRVLHRNGPARDIIVDDMPGNDVAALRVVSRADGLPVTGASVFSVALAGVVALVLGILAVLVARPPRRRRRELTPPDRPTWRAGV